MIIRDKFPKIIGIFLINQKILSNLPHWKVIGRSFDHVGVFLDRLLDEYV